ncbi:hypothetical protein SNEBB_004569 [Seison nebaliae]|nr:hypothetical protein SNEBB_004569 [Seison nebaliae]
MNSPLHMSLLSVISYYADRNDVTNCYRYMDVYLEDQWLNANIPEILMFEMEYKAAHLLYHYTNEHSLAAFHCRNILIRMKTSECVIDLYEEYKLIEYTAYWLLVAIYKKWEHEVDMKQTLFAANQIEYDGNDSRILQYKLRCALLLSQTLCEGYKSHDIACTLLEAMDEGKFNKLQRIYLLLYLCYLKLKNGCDVEDLFENIDHRISSLAVSIGNSNELLDQLIGEYESCEEELLIVALYYHILKTYHFVMADKSLLVNNEVHFSQILIKQLTNMNKGNEPLLSTFKNSRIMWIRKEELISVFYIFSSVNYLTNGHMIRARINSDKSMKILQIANINNRLMKSIILQYEIISLICEQKMKDAIDLYGNQSDLFSTSQFPIIKLFDQFIRMWINFRLSNFDKAFKEKKEIENSLSNFHERFVENVTLSLRNIELSHYLMNEKKFHKNSNEKILKKMKTDLLSKNDHQTKSTNQEIVQCLQVLFNEMIYKFDNESDDYKMIEKDILSYVTTVCRSTERKIDNNYVNLFIGYKLMKSGDMDGAKRICRRLFKSSALMKQLEYASLKLLSRIDYEYELTLNRVEQTYNNVLEGLRKNEIFYNSHLKSELVDMEQITSSETTETIPSN